MKAGTAGFEPRTLPGMDRADRAIRTIGAFTELGCKTMLVTKPVNVRWLTGFTGSEMSTMCTAFVPLCTA